MLYRFGACRLDIERRQLVREGVEAPLSPKALDLLRLLIDARPRVLSKAEIMDLLWPDTYVAEANIAILIGDIRAAVGDTARNPTLIKTHHGRGYSFCGEVAELVRRPSVPLSGPIFTLIVGQRRVVLPRGTLTAGRDPSSDLVLPDPSVSRAHARLFVGPEQVEVEDLGSKNGTRVHGARIDCRVPLSHGGEIVFGSIRARLQVEHSTNLSTVTIDDVRRTTERT
jgi:DNA-binding winged helix-turn-helix (wHTH) protein